MFPQFNLYSTPLLLLTLQGLIFFFLLFYKYRRTKDISFLLLSLILLITCYHQTSYTLGFMSWYDTFRNTKINYFLINSSLALAPLIYFYIRSVTRPATGWKKMDFIHFLPMVIVLLIRLIIFIYDAAQPGFNETQNGYLVLNFQWKYLDPFTEFLSMIQMLIYLALSFQMVHIYRQRIKELFSNTFKLELNWLLIFLIMYSFLYLYHSVQNVINATIVDLSWKQEWWYYMFSGLAIIYVGIRGFYTNLSKLKEVEIASFLGEHKVQVIPKPVQEKNDDINPEILKYKSVVAQHMEEAKPFLDPDTNLVSLAKQIGISREELSEIINKGFNKKFNDFINRFRIDAFKDKIKEGKHVHLSLLGIAYECGFNSKSTFNRAFKKETGLSPTEFIKGME